MKLIDIAEVIMGQSPLSSSYNNEGKGLPFFQGKADFGDNHPIPKIFCTESTKIAYPGDILTSVRAPIGSVNFNVVESCIGRGLAAIRPLREEDKLFIYYLLEASEAYLQKLGTGSTFKAINKNSLCNLKFTNISPKRREKIGLILSHVDALKRAGIKELSLLSQLQSSRFIELFGNYPENPKGWPDVRIRDVVKEVRYGSSRRASSEGKYPYLRMNNITYQGDLDLSDIKYIDIPDNELDNCTVKKGDVLFNRTNSKELVGKTCVYDRDELMVLAGFIIRVRVNDQILPEFLSAFLNADFSKQMLAGKCKAAIGQANINARELQNIGIYLPPIELQNKYIRLKRSIGKSKFVGKMKMENCRTRQKMRNLF